MADSQHTHHLLSKQKTWPPDINRDLEWQKLRMKQRSRYKTHKLCRSKSIDHVRDVTDDDIKELKACFDLGFGFDKLDDFDDPKLMNAFPALKMYAAIKQGYNSGGTLSRTSSMNSDSCSSSSSVATSIVDPSDDSEKVKMKLKQWAQLVRYSILETSSDNKNVAE
ncbi:hypothetical protein CTI12_AA093510 [Artemisia annua]|uniref:Uncharacterized protein n=1 Tax=Artemisia annua TaxID=35608 RepID=A0A2U1PI73_ARTAN|nr:hypothetical protein CTI12_AA093510 [Artemisia annua]